MENFLGIKGIKGNLYAGVGFVIIPENVDRAEYIEDVYSSGRLSVYGGYGHSNFYDILIDRENLQRIKFPTKVGDFGSPVVWLNIPKHNEPIVISVLKYDEDFFELSENRRRDTLTDNGNIVDLDLDAKKGVITISGNGVTKKSVLNIDLNSRDDDSVLKVRINGEILMRSSDRFVQISEKKIEQAVSDVRGIVKARSKMENDVDSGVSYIYEDSNGNRISADKDSVTIKADTSKKINLGGGSDPIVLGNALKEILEEFDDALSMMTVPTAFGPSGTRLNGVQFKQVRNRFDEFLSKLSNTD